MYPIGRPAGRASDRLAGWTLALAGVVPIARYLWIVAHRVAYPYELQWMEGGTVELVNRLIRGRSLYTAPTLRFTPWPYPPFYFLVSSALARVIGVGFLPLRLVSIAASIGVLLVIGVLVHGETDDRAAAVFAAGVYAATFRLAGAWADIGRVDSLWLLLCLGAVLAARRAASWRAGALVGVVFFLASFTKQDGLIVAAPVIVALVVARRRAGIAAAGLLASLVAVSTIVMNASTGGWYGFYVGRELLDQPFDLHQLAAFWTRDLLTSLPVVSALAIVGCAAVVRAARGAPRGGAPVLLASVVGLVAAGWVGRIHSGGYANVLMPAYAGLAVVAGIGAHRVRNRARRRLSSVARRVATASFLVAVGVQLAALTYPARAQIPTRADSRAGDRFLELVRSLPGRVVVLIHPWYGTVAGKGDFAAGAAVQDLLRSQPSRARVALVRDERTALLAPDIGAVVLDQAPDPILAPQLAGSYTKVSDRAIIGTAFFPVTDLRLRPAFVYVRDGPRPGATQVVADERRG